MICYVLRFMVGYFLLTVVVIFVFPFCIYLLFFLDEVYKFILLLLFLFGKVLIPLLVFKLIERKDVFGFDLHFCEEVGRGKVYHFLDVNVINLVD